jgi:DNA ligase-associated metallophosphoesterase
LFDRRSAEGAIAIGGISLVADCAGALFWPEQSVLALADLHLEKGSSFAARGVLLPPYDTAATLARLSRLILRYAPRAVIALGDSFHDGGGPARVGNEDRATLSALQRGREWIWIAGNHDPEPVAGLGGVSADTLAIGTLAFRHKPASGTAAGEIAGHLHPVALLCRRRRAHRDAGFRHLCGRPQRPVSRLCPLVRHAELHGAHAG